MDLLRRIPPPLCARARRRGGARCVGRRSGASRRRDRGRCRGHRPRFGGRRARRPTTRRGRVVRPDPEQARSRSVSPDAIVDAIAEELGGATGADHVVVVRREESGRWRPTSSASAQASRPIDAAGDRRPGGRHPRPPGAPAEIADRIARQVRNVYGLGQVMAVPLSVGETVVGAIVVSRRVGATWPESTRRILNGAAVEASAALSRAVSHRDAEVRAATDSLTGLPNRRYFDEFVGLLAHGRRAGDAVGIDGRHRQVQGVERRARARDGRCGPARRGCAIVSAVREDDVQARFGGEFVVLLRNPAPGVAVEVGERIRAMQSAGWISGAGRPAVSVGGCRRGAWAGR